LSAFSVEHEIAEIDGENLKVSFWFVVGASRLGFPGIYEDVTASAGRIEALLRHRDHRAAAELMPLPLDELFRRIEVGTFVYADPGLEAGRDWGRFERFVVTPRDASSFDGWTAFLVESEDNARLIWREPSTRRLHEARLTRGELDQALLRFHQGLRQLIESARHHAPKSGARAKGRLRDVG